MTDLGSPRSARPGAPRRPAPRPWPGEQASWPGEQASYGPAPHAHPTHAYPAAPYAYPVAPVVPVAAAPSPSAFRWTVLACATLVALAGVVLAGVLLWPQTVALTPIAQPTTVLPGPATVVQAPVPVASGSSSGSSGSSGHSSAGYSCGSTGGHTVYVENGTVPCDHALLVAGQWLSTGTTPGAGEGDAGTMYSWSCVTDSDGDGWCTSKMGSHLSVS